MMNSGEKYLTFFKEQWVLLAAILSPIALIAFVFWGWQTYDGFAASQRRMKLALIDDQKDKVDRDLSAQIEKLNTELTAVGEAQDLASLTKKEELQQQIDGSKPDYKEVIAAYRSFFEKHSKAAEGRIAGVRVAQIFMAAGDYSAAKDILALIFQDGKLDLFYELHIRPMYAALLEEIGEYQEALQELNKIYTTLSTVDGLGSTVRIMKPKVLYAKARIGSALGDSQIITEAVDLVTQSYPMSEEA
ncbi:MAG: hypothetical protein OXC40_07425, partial [Proteobacteria bacterium]|nr:hypothetical protein [Pseudomonadota bacterium]